MASSEEIASIFPQMAENFIPEKAEGVDATIQFELSGDNGGNFWLYEPRFGFSQRFGRPGTSHPFSIYQKNWQDVKPEFYAMTEEENKRVAEVVIDDAKNDIGKDLEVEVTSVLQTTSGKMIFGKKL